MRRRQRRARWRRERRFLTVWALPTVRADSRGEGEPERAVTCSQTQGGPWNVTVHLRLGKLRRPCFTLRTERLSRKCSTDSRSSFNSHMPYDVLPQNATIDSREVRVSDNSRLTRPTEIQNSLALANPAADRAVPCRKSEISHQQNGGGVVSTQIGPEPVRLEAKGQTAVQCRKTRICSSRTVTRIGYAPVRLEAHG